MITGWTLTLWIELCGWAVSVPAFSWIMKKFAEDNEARAETAEGRAVWSTDRGKSQVVFVLFVAWPLVIISAAMTAVAVSLDALDAYRSKKTKKED